MRCNCWQVLMLTVAVILAAGAQGVAQEPRKSDPGAAPPVKAPDPARMKQLLGVWEQQSAKLTSLDVRIKRLDRSAQWGDEEYAGRAILMSPNLAWLDFQKLVHDEKLDKDRFIPHERIVCTGAEVWQYRSDTHQIFIFTLDKQNQKRAIEEGPLPFLFNMKAADAEARYQMHLVTEMPDYFVISIVPNLQIDRESFSKAFLKLNRQTFLPDRIYLVSPDGKSIKDFTLTSVKPNAAVAPENFKGQVLGPPWTVVKNPVEGGDAPAAPGIGTRPPATGPTVPSRRR
jgi:TIGR03009 family protein